MLPRRSNAIGKDGARRIVVVDPVKLGQGVWRRQWLRLD